MENNVRDTALIIEGGGMRASYTSGMINVLLEQEIYFDYVAGVSAGSSCAVNYLSRDCQRVRQSFVELAGDPNFGGWASFVKGRGFFNSQYIYETVGQAGQAMPFDFKTFKDNPARLRLGAYLPAVKRTVYFTKEEMGTLGDLMRIVRASSSLPIVMPPTEFKGQLYFDGGLGGGIALDAPLNDGYQRFFVLLSQPRSYFKKPPRNPGLIKGLFRRDPALCQATLTRWQHYNRQKEQLLRLEEEGRAFLVFPRDMTASHTELKISKLSENYEKGYAQGKAQVEDWMRFLQL